MGRRARRFRAALRHAAVARAWRRRVSERPPFRHGRPSRAARRDARPGCADRRVCSPASLKRPAVSSSVKRPAGGLRLRIASALAGELAAGDSLAVNGVCLTVIGRTRERFTPTSGRRRSASRRSARCRPASSVNLERPLRADSRFGGHFVQGHVDAIGCVEDRRPEAEFEWLTVSFPAPLAPYFVLKGSIAVDGISLTVAGLGIDRFDVQIVPYTLAHTNLRSLAVGDRVNLECDMVGKYVARAAELAGVDRERDTYDQEARNRQRIPARRPIRSRASRMRSRRSGPAGWSSSSTTRIGRTKGDLTIAAEKVTPEAINFMARYGRGLICLSMTPERLDRARDSADGVAEHLAVRHRVLRADRGERPDDDRHLGGRSRRDGARGDRSRHAAVGSGASRAHVSPALAHGRRASSAPGRPRRPSIWRGSPGSIPPASSAKS